MVRREFIRRIVLDTICDDFENLDQVILRDVAGQCVKLGIVVERSEVISALASLVEDGLAKAYDFDSSRGGDPFSAELPGMPSLVQVEEDFRNYFLTTKKGMEFHLSDDAWWPFDDDGERLPDWRLEELPESD